MVDFTELGEMNQMLAALISLAGNREISTVTLSASPSLSHEKLKEAYGLLSKDHFQTKGSDLTINVMLPRRMCMNCKTCFRGAEGAMCPKCHSLVSTERAMPRLYIESYSLRSEGDLAS
ncbi:MAG: hydrogenase/urease maturation nickel metallochaperone HypA [Actinomycetota bacterium]|nr:hydrogenase/urease maturation nickel metallochaperone HypA [Actinomycetota bacterium]